MSDFKACPLCGRYDFQSWHRCPPAWSVYQAFAGPNAATTVYADSPEEAAKLYAGDYLWDSDMTDAWDVIVTGADGKAYHYRVRVEPRPALTAELVEWQGSELSQGEMHGGQS